MEIIRSRTRNRLVVEPDGFDDAPLSETLSPALAKLAASMDAAVAPTAVARNWRRESDCDCDSGWLGMLGSFATASLLFITQHWVRYG